MGTSGFSRTCVTVACLAALLAAAPAAAAPKFTKPRPVTPLDVHGLRAAADSSGRITIVWGHYDDDHGGWEVKARRISARGKPRPIHKLGRARWLPDLAVATNGDATVVWDDYFNDGVQMSRIGPDGVPEPPQTVGPIAASPPKVAVGDAGRVVIAWPGAFTYAVRVNPDGVPNSAQELGPRVRPVTVAVDRGGRATIAGSSEEDKSMRAVGLESDGTIGPWQEVSPPGSAGGVFEDTFGGGPAMQLSDDGTASLAWQGVGRGSSVRLARIPPDGSPARVALVSRRTAGFDRALAVAPGGRATVAWNPPGPSLVLRQVGADGDLARVRKLAPRAKGPKRLPLLANASRRRLVAGWTIGGSDDPLSSEDDHRRRAAQVAWLSPRGRTKSFATLPGPRVETDLAALVVDEKDRLTAFTQAQFPARPYGTAGRYLMTRAKD